MVTLYLLILHCHREMLMVVPLINGDTTLTSIFHFIQDTGILEGALFHLSRLFLKFLWFLCQHPLPPFVDQMGMNVKLTWAMCPMMTVLIWVYFATWLRFSGGFHNTCVLVENQLLARSTIFTIYQVPIYTQVLVFFWIHFFEYIFNLGIILDLQNIWKEEFGTLSPSFI